MENLRLQEFRDAGIIIATLFSLVMITWMLRPILLKWLDDRKDTRDRELDIENDRVQADKDGAKALVALGEQLKEDQVRQQRRLEDERAAREAEQAIVSTLTTAVTHLTQLIQQANETMTGGVRQRNEKLSAIHQSVQDLPLAVWAEGDPRLDAIKASIEQVLAGMEARITDKLNPAADNARAAVRSELAHLEKQLDHVFARIEDIDRSLKMLQKPEPGEHKTEAKESQEELNDGTK